MGVKIIYGQENPDDMSTLNHLHCEICEKILGLQDATYMGPRPDGGKQVVCEACMVKDKERIDKESLANAKAD